MLPPQVFRVEKLLMGMTNGTPILYGTLYWRAWVHGKWFSGKMEDHFMYGHQVGIGVGSKLSSRHDFHLEPIDDPSKHLGKGVIYFDFLQDERARMNAT